MDSARRISTADRRRVTKLVMRDLAVEARDIHIAQRVVYDAERFSKLWVGLTIAAVILLIVDVGVAAASGSWHWLSLLTPPLLIVAGLINLRRARRARIWTAHHPQAGPAS